MAREAGAVLDKIFGGNSPPNRGAEWGGVCGGGVPSPADKDVWESVVSSPSGVQAEPRPKTYFCVRYFEGHLFASICQYVEFVSVSCHIWGKVDVFWGTIHSVPRRTAMKYYQYPDPE